MSWTCKTVGPDDDPGDTLSWCFTGRAIRRSVGGVVAAAGALGMTGGKRVELEGLARSHTASAREVRQAQARWRGAAAATDA